MLGPVREQLLICASALLVSLLRRHASLVSRSGTKRPIQLHVAVFAMSRRALFALLMLASCDDAARAPAPVEEERGWVSLPDDGPSGYMIHENDLGFAVYCSDGHVFHMVSSPEQPFSIDDGFFMGSLAGTLSDWACNDEGTLCATAPPASPRVRDEIIMFSQLGQSQTYSFYMEGTTIPRDITLEWGSFPGGMRSFLLRCRAAAPGTNPAGSTALREAADRVAD